MHYWHTDISVSALLVDLGALAGLLAVAMLLVRFVPLLRRLSMPVAILAGLLGLALGPSGAGLIPLEQDAMEVLVYHAFALMFIAVGLQSAPRTQRPGAARSLAVGNATIGVSQAILGLLFVAAWLAIEPLHPGFGLMITLGFQQGPGQALSLGGAWESSGMLHGGQIGLIFATLGFLYCFVLGVPMVWLARRRGWLTREETRWLTAQGEPAAGSPVDPETTTSTHEPLSMQLVLIGCIYVLVFGIITGLVGLLPPGNKMGETFWGLHFIVGSLLAIGLRRGARRLGHDQPFHDGMLARISVVLVELTTVGAIAAVRLEVLGTWLVPILLMTLLAGSVTLTGCMWLSRRAFPEAPFSHGLALFGAGTGTISTGLALLRMLDPELRGPVARNSVIGATASIPFNAPLFMVVIPIVAVPQWDHGPAAALGIPLAALGVYLAVLVVCWRMFTPLRLLRPLTSLWPPEPREDAALAASEDGLASNEAVSYIPPAKGTPSPQEGDVPRRSSR